ncbi:hypothetical protein Ddye_024836 [Dipteronia dyeriana]|uniref:MBD domain-containing protein n=1 Tax=Dipteronia dyeriana TaxID=168575 RepID=A0AAD9TWM0_9ROSI|nr:hypothetical protein Ddye_024836 [Dipteronia dyeriana]
MSTTAPSQMGRDPILNSHRPGTPEPDIMSSTVDLPPDPLLDSGSFIYPNSFAPTTTSASTITNSNDQTLNSNNNGEPIRDRQSTAPATSNGASESATTPEKTPLRRSAAAQSGTTAEKPPHRRSAAAVSTESPNWLPQGWKVEDRVRTSGATAGMVDKYYLDPSSGCRFRSKKEVLYFLEFGTKRKKKNSDTEMESLGSSGSSKQKKSGAKGKTSALNFDYFNAPEKVQWVLTANSEESNSEESWIPFIGEEKVPESVKKDWAKAYAAANSNGH